MKMASGVTVSWRRRTSRLSLRLASATAPRTATLSAGSKKSISRYVIEFWLLEPLAPVMCTVPAAGMISSDPAPALLQADAKALESHHHAPGLVPDSGKT